MKIIKAGYEIMTPIDEADIYKKIEQIGRTCYKSEAKITTDSAERFVRGLVKRGHEAMLEHASITVKFIVDRGVSHEIVRHRIASFAQESSRYVNYSKDKFGKEITVIEPCFFNDIPDYEKNLCIKALDSVWPHDDDVNKFFDSGINDRHRAFARWYDACRFAESAYFTMLDHGCTPQEARSVLPNSLKTELIVTMNLREWRHFFKLRAVGVTGAPHPQMSEVAVPLMMELIDKLPAVFDDLTGSER